jgi:hypothetical protein
VRFSASAGFAALLALSLAGKLLANQAPPGADPGLFVRSAGAMLRDGGFEASVEPRKAVILVRGARGGCRLILGEYDPHGTFAELYRELAAPVGPLRFAWRGRVYEAAPKVRGLAAFYGWRELRRIGLAPPRAPIAAWAATPGCDTGRLDWGRLASLPA